MQLLIEKTVNTPLVSFQNGVLEIAGRAIPENALIFFEPLFKFISEYSKVALNETIVNVRLDYANSSTNRSLMTIFTLLEKIHENGKSINVNWLYEKDDDLMFELGTDYKTLLRMPFHLKEY